MLLARSVTELIDERRSELHCQIVREQTDLELKVGRDRFNKIMVRTLRTDVLNKGNRFKDHHDCSACCLLC